MLNRPTFGGHIKALVILFSYIVMDGVEIASYPFEIIFSQIHFRPSSSRFYPLTIAIFLYRISRGRMVVIAEACPPSDIGEATEKLYERHCLVIKIVSSFFCLSDKVFVSLSIDIQ